MVIMKRNVIHKEFNTNFFVLLIYGVASVLGIGTGIFFGVYSLLKIDLFGILIFAFLLFISILVFRHAQKKTKEIEYEQS
jgi:uncharacterized membrane protein YfcA